jgi:predicted ATPase/class 3 adenylate cyclase
LSSVRDDLPSGTVTFLFTDIEGSTKLLKELGADSYADALAEHRILLREAFTRHGGVEVDTQGDAFFYAFPTAPGALEAAREGTNALAAGPIRVRMGIHTGAPRLTEEGYIGEDVHLGARIGAAGHGGQVLVSLETRNLVDVELTDLGEHRLKDFDEPVWIFQLEKERFPPLKTISNTNLPRPPSSFVGRDGELAEILERVRNGARLLTLTGPGGTGKTRLAIEAAAAVVTEYRNGVFWVGLAPLRDASLVVDAIGQTLGAKDGLAAHIAEREMLLLLDNFEQVVGAAPELSALLAICPNLRLLVTSRELLRVQGEVEYPVPPLAQPEAVKLFSARSRLEADGAIATLCARLDNLPLAVELAAARTSALTPVQILERLTARLDLLRGGRDADPRQATLRATIAWSHDLLAEPERQLFARLSVFAGCTLESAEKVAGADLDTLQSLVEKSLLRRTGERFWMLETILEYAAERLRESGEADELGERHAEHFLALAEEAEPHLELHPERWIQRLERELDNLRSALDRLETSGETQRALRLGGVLAVFWDNHLTEARLRLDRLLDADDSPTEARAKALIALAAAARQSGEATVAEVRASEALALYRELGHMWGIAQASLVIGLAVGDQGDFSRARRLFSDSAHGFDDLGDEGNAVFATRLLAWMYLELGDRERCSRLNEENLVRARALGNRQMVGQTLGALAGLAIDEGRVQDAVPMLQEVLEIDRDLGLPLQLAIDLLRFARAIARLGEAAKAAMLLACSEAIREEVGVGTPPPYVSALIEDVLAVSRPQLDDSTFGEAWKEGRGLTPDEAIALALATSDIGRS